jgi:16S rRNA (guanine527-N7)-methyltransferase
MDKNGIAELLAPYLGSEKLADAQLAKISAHLDLLLKWNGRMNLTAVRDPAQIVTRHFGEALFTARHLFPAADSEGTLADVGSGAGFPGLPIAIARPHLHVTLIEAHGKKAVFLKESVRAAGIANVRVLASRAESCIERFDVVAFRAVERFREIVPISATLAKPQGRLAGLVGSSQVEAAEDLIGGKWETSETVNFPGSTQGMLWIATNLTV